MDVARHRPTRRAVVLVAAAVVAAQLGLAAGARADTSTTLPSTTTVPPTTVVATTVVRAPTTTVAAPTATTPTGETTVTIPTLQPGGSTAPAGPPLADPSPHIRVLLAQLEVLDGEKGVTLATQSVEQLQAAQAKATAEATRAAFDVRTDERQLTNARSQLATVATMAFMGAGGGVLSSVLNGGPDAGTQEREMVSSTIQHHGEVEIAASRRLDAGKASLARARRRVHAAAVQVTLGKVRLARSEGTLTDARHDLSHSGSDTWALSIEGDSAFTAAELNLWFTSQGRQADASVPIDQLTGFYVSEGEAEGVRGDMAFAQSLVETGSFTNPDTISLNNFAGIGHCDSCASGLAFKTAQLGVRGQMQLLKSYAEKSPTYADPLVDPRLHGPAGCCQTWTQLTKSWASDPNYGPKILGVYEAMLEWLLVARAAEPGPPPALVVSASLVSTSTTTTIKS